MTLQKSKEYCNRSSMTAGGKKCVGILTEKSRKKNITHNQAILASKTL